MCEIANKVEIWAKCGDDFFYGLEGEKKDYELAVSFDEKAMKEKHPRATFMFGLCKELGRGVEKDKEHAEVLYDMASGYGNKDAQKRITTGKVVVPPPPSRGYENGDEDTEMMNWKII